MKTSLVLLNKINEHNCLHFMVQFRCKNIHIFVRNYTITNFKQNRKVSNCTGMDIQWKMLHFRQNLFIQLCAVFMFATRILKKRIFLHTNSGTLYIPSD